MGRLRSLAGRVVRKVTGGERAATTPPPTPARAPASPSTPPGAALATIDCGAQELFERLGAGERIVLVDVRTEAELRGGVLPGARHIPLSELEARWEELSDADEIVCYCAAGVRSLRAARVLRQHGLINATSLEGGVTAWTAVGGQLVAAG